MNENTMTLAKWAERNTGPWFAGFDEHDMDQAEICRKDAERRGCWVGPLAKVPVGTGEINEDGTTIACLDEGEDGVTLFLVLLLPEIANMLLWANESLTKLNGIHFDPASDAGKFHVELRHRINEILCRVNGRPDRAEPGVLRA